MCVSLCDACAYAYAHDRAGVFICVCSTEEDVVQMHVVPGSDKVPALQTRVCMCADARMHTMPLRHSAMRRHAVQAEACMHSLMHTSAVACALVGQDRMVWRLLSCMAIAKTLRSQAAFRASPALA